MSLDPTSPSSPRHQLVPDTDLSASQPYSAQHAVAPEHAAAGASHEQHKHADTRQPSRDMAKARDSDAFESPSVVRVTVPQVIQSEATSKPRTIDASATTSAYDVAHLAPELLMRVFAFLDPVSLCRAATVCRPWAVIARDDDATWRAAFATYFSLEAAQAHRTTSLEASATPALRRLTSASWRQEFQQRVDLLRRWRKSRTPTVLSHPRVDIIKKISLSKQHRLMVSATDTYGVASRSNPWTGKVIKGYLDAEGTANGAGNGNPNAEFSPNVTSLNMSSDASHIFWGFRSGEVGMTTMSRQGTNPRGLIKSIRFTPRASHAGPVTAIAIPFASDCDGAHGPGRSPERLRQAIAMLGDVASTFVTAGFDGTVRMWSSTRPWPLWVASTSAKTPPPNSITSGTQAQNNASAPAPICTLAYNAKHGVVAAGSSTGKVFVWSNIDVAALLRIPAEATDAEHLGNGAPETETLEAQTAFQRLSQSFRATTIDMPPGVASEVAVSSIIIDASPSTSAADSEDCCLLVHHSGASVLLRHRILCDSARPVETTVLGAALMDEVTAIRADFEPRLPKRDVRSSSAQSPSTSVYASPVLGPATGPSLVPQAPTLVLGPTPFETYTGSGQYPERKYVAVGTKAGSLFLFDWDSAGTAFDEDTQEEWQGSSPPRFRGSHQLLPSIGWEAHHTSITALELTPLHILVGTSDGTIKVFDSLAGDLIRTINDRTATKHPARMLAAGELTPAEAARFRVTQIIADHECLVASIGHQVLAFRADPVLSKRAAAAAAAGAKGKAGGAARARLGESKYALQVELKRDLRESKAELQAEREERQAEYSQMRNRQTFELEGLSEQEALEYALMLSRDEEAAAASGKAQSMGGASGGYVPGSYASSSRKRIEVAEAPVEDAELADALEQIALAESKAQAEAQGRRRFQLLDDQDFGADDEDSFDDPELDWYLRASPLASPCTSPYMRGLSSPPSRAWTMLSNVQQTSCSSSSSPGPERWGTGGKVRTVKVPFSARLSPTPAEAMAGVVSLGSSVGSNGSALEIGSQAEFPSMSVSPLSLHRSQVGGAGCDRRASPAWARRKSATSSSHDDAAKLNKGKHKEQEGEHEVDEELRFAIELSLAEHKSKQDPSVSF